MTTQLMLFDYDALDSETRVVVQQKTTEIRDRVENIKRNTIEIGQRLRDVKERLDHGQFGPWLEVEFEWSRETATNMMRVAALVEENRKFYEFEDRFARTALYLLAAPSTPGEARDEALERAGQGETITHSAATEITNRHKQPDDDLKEEDPQWLEDNNLRPRPEEDPEPGPPPPRPAEPAPAKEAGLPPPPPAKKEPNQATSWPLHIAAVIRVNGKVLVTAHLGPDQVADVVTDQIGLIDQVRRIVDEYSPARIVELEEVV